MTQPADARRCAVVFNPTKVGDGFRPAVDAVLARDGWQDTLWLETAEDDPGRSMTAEAVAAGVDLVVAAGGDGTVRVVADGLADSGITMGVIPSGTGNLLARCLGLPEGVHDAVDVAFGSQARTIDLIRVTADDRRPEHVAVIAGLGVDAMTMEETNPDLKAKVGSAAYFLAAAKALKQLPIRMTVQVDDHKPLHRNAMICAIANIGELRGGIDLVPGAVLDDGRLDVFVASPRRVRHWLKLAVRLVRRRPAKDDQVDQVSGTKVVVRLRSEDSYELDGDVAGKATVLTAEVRPGALTVRVPGSRTG